MKPLPTIAVLSLFSSLTVFGQEENTKFLGFVDQVRFKGQTMMNVGLKFGMKGMHPVLTIATSTVL